MFPCIISREIAAWPLLRVAKERLLALHLQGNAAAAAQEWQPSVRVLSRTCMPSRHMTHIRNCYAVP